MVSGRLFSRAGLLCLTLAAGATRAADDAAPRPVTQDASPEAVKLLEYLYEIKGKHTMTGQHNVPLNGSLRLPAVWRAAGKYPALFGQDFGFSEPGTWDGINYRQQIVDEAIRRHEEGFVITIMWHAVRPIDDEPVEFRDSIQGKLTDDQWRELVTPGTDLNERWQSQVDVVAWHLRQLRNAHVPVLWRPYHEMNGGWFWWGQKKGDDGYKKLWRMLFERLVEFHQLDNLIWVYNCNEEKEGVDLFETYYPGDEYVDVLAADVYDATFPKKQHDRLLEVAKGKPIAIGECGAIPSEQTLKDQPQWAWFMAWGEPGGRDFFGYRQTYASERALTHDELPWTKVKKPTVHDPLLR